MHLTDIKKTQAGNWYFDINEDTEDKKTKTGKRRLIPMHSKLIELGLIEYVEELKAKGEHRLFPELKRSRDGYSQGVSKWFGRFLRKDVGISDRKKVFHSFRHTVASGLRQKDVPVEKIAAILGHTKELGITDTYAKNIPVDNLKAEIEKLKFATE